MLATTAVIIGRQAIFLYRLFWTKLNYFHFGLLICSTWNCKHCIKMGAGRFRYVVWVPWDAFIRSLSEHLFNCLLSGALDYLYIEVVNSTIMKTIGKSRIVLSGSLNIQKLVVGVLELGAPTIFVCSWRSFSPEVVPNFLISCMFSKCPTQIFLFFFTNTPTNTECSVIKCLWCCFFCEL